MPTQETELALQPSDDLLATQEYELVPLHRLVEHPANPRRGDDELIAESVSLHGFYGAIVAQTSTGRVLAGNHRLKAAHRLGMPTLPVLWLDVSDEEAVRILLDDNRAADLATYDNQRLARLLQAIQAETDTLVGTLYTDSDLSALLSALTAPPDFLPNNTDSGILPEQASAVRMVQLYLDVETLPAFVAAVDVLQERTGLDNLTETVYRTVLDAAGAISL